MVSSSLLSVLFFTLTFKIVIKSGEAKQGHLASALTEMPDNTQTELKDSWKIKSSWL